MNDWLRTSTAPMFGITRPELAAARLDRASPALVLVTLSVHLAVIAGFITGVATAHGADRPDVLFGVLLLAGVGLSVATAWLNVPLVQRRETLGVAMWRAVAVVTSGLGLLGLLVVLVAVAIMMAMRSTPETPIPVFLAMTVAGCSGLLFVTWVARSAQGLSDHTETPYLPPRCEDCGYDLTHQPADRRCPECGLLIDLSLGPACVRRGIAWAENPTPESWANGSLETLLRPHDFYRRLHLRCASPTSPDPLRLANRFSRLHYVGLALGSAIAAAVSVALTDGPPSRFVPAFGLFIATLSACGAWAAHRTLTAAWGTWWIASRALPDGRWAAIATAYETAFLWLPFGTLWALVFSYAAFGQWISSLLGEYWGWRAFGAPAEIVVLFAAMGALGILWCWRYSHIARWIRYANY